MQFSIVSEDIVGEEGRSSELLPFLDDDDCVWKGDIQQLKFFVKVYGPVSSFVHTSADTTREESNQIPTRRARCQDFSQA